MKLIIENWRKYVLQEVKTDTLISLIERGLYKALKSTEPEFNEEGGDVKLGVVMFQFVSESGYKQDVKLRVYTTVYDFFKETPIVDDYMRPSMSADPWLKLMKNVEPLMDIPITEKQIAELDKYNILNKLKFIAIAFLRNDAAYTAANKKDLANIRTAATGKVTLDFDKQVFKDKPTDKTSEPSWLDQWTSPAAGDTDIVIGSVILPLKQNYRDAFRNVLSSITHELEHTFQKDDGESAVGALGGRGSTVEKRMKYLLLPKEVEAHSAQFYFLSKRRKQPWKELVTTYLTQQFETATERDIESGTDAVEAKQLKDEAIDAVFNAWAEYTVMRFPAADTGIDAAARKTAAVKKPENFTSKKTSDQDKDWEHFLKTGKIKW